MTSSGTDWHFLELTEIGRRIRAREISPVEATTAQLGRIAALDGRLRSYAHVMADQAMAQARAAEAAIGRGDIRGPLHGVPIAVKDLCWTRDAPTAAGMPIHRNFRPEEDATVVRRLAAAGAVILGKLQLTEGAYADHHPDVPAPVNPWDAATWSGASSSGSGVATAAGLCYGSLGSDTGGSIRFPSAANGVTGLKPTWGRVSRYGVFELAATLDHVGPMARSAADCGAILGAIAGADPKDPTASLEPMPNYLAGLGRGLRGLRIGVAADFNAGADAEMLRATEEALRVVAALGGEIREVRFPAVDQVIEDWFPLCAVETAVAHEATYPARKAEYGPALSALIEQGRGVSGLDYQKIVLRRHDFAGRVRALFEGIDLLVVPAQGFASPTVAGMATLGQDPALIARLLRFTCPFDMTGSPTITLPCGFTERGTPIAFQFVSRHFEEDLLTRAGHAYQQATDWHRRHPAL
ncbi:amidase [Paracraurococcus ruber]|uniref:Asp-tRNA(Asn)/Glu-tRNA(Gln) amidotransferase GatCAB subunit A n=1 Tax=Paracraurococcus ruber TaxID=77675 RepID=A0ABS1CVJ2_9PROT|nr:amidase [Paracraurococcus ruber]MBK1658538.1 Asp-tRNA(Asn)/Glu-tRNA(Gln) amidotransferase GatCAB subunit A [Paracraurococcus ruber]TDG33173.1 amidase [Paracraurococcus ruber]